MCCCRRENLWFNSREDLQIRRALIVSPIEVLESVAGEKRELDRFAGRVHATSQIVDLDSEGHIAGDGSSNTGNAAVMQEVPYLFGVLHDSGV